MHTPPLPARTVLLRHDLPDGSWHWDWMLERAPGKPLLSFRISARVDLPETLEFQAQRTPDHRPTYLHYQGPVSNNRGTVTRIASGTVESLSDEPGECRVTVAFGPFRRTWSGRPKTDPHWQFQTCET
ncbi:MAG: hypothetical protein U0637_09670 [Phycisphaerales bacterium]